MMQTLREALKEHQEATDTDDETMLTIVCEFIESVDDKGFMIEDDLIWFVVDRLERGPGVVD